MQSKRPWTIRGALALLLAGMLALAACEGGFPWEAARRPAATPAAEPTLDLEQIPILGDDSAPLVPLLTTDARFPIPPARGAVADRGRLLYEEFCASCHGVDGAGQQPDPLARGAAPPHDAGGHTWHHTDQENFLTVWQGRSIAGSMPGFHDQLAPDQIIDVLAYIKTWWEPDQLEHQMGQTRLLAEQ